MNIYDERKCGKLFCEFKDIANTLSLLGGVVQNPDSLTSDIAEKELKDFNKHFDKVLNDLGNLRFEVIQILARVRDEDE